MKMVNGREIPDFAGEYTSQECINKLVELLTECANAFSTTIDGDTLLLSGLSVAGDSTFTLGAANVITIDAGTTDHTGANVITFDVDVNSANCKAINMDIDVGTALSTGESVSGLYIDIDGSAADHANSILNGISLTSANTSGSSTNSALRLAGTWDYLVYSLANSATGIGLAGNHTSALSINGTNTNAIAVAGTVSSALKVTSTPAYAAYSSAGTGSRNTPFIKIGSWDDPLALTNASDHFVALQINMTNDGNVSYDFAAARLKVASAGATTSNLNTLELRETIGHNVAQWCTLQCSAAPAAHTIGTGEGLVAYFKMEGSGTITPAGSNAVAVMEIINEHAGAGVSDVCLIRENATGQTSTNILKVENIVGTVTNALSVINTGGTVTNGINIGYGTYGNSALTVGAFSSSYATGSAIPFSATCTGVAKFYGESTSDLTSAVNARTIVGRHLIVTSSATVNHETYGIIGQVCVKNTSLGHYHGGVMGTYESNTAATILTDYGVGGIVGRLGAASTTVNSGGILAGVLAVENTASWTNNGTIAAFAAMKTAGGVAWPIGIFMKYDGVAKILEAGSAVNPIVNDTADTKFVQIYTDCGASSGDNRGIYNRLYLTSTGGGESLRSYTDVSGTVGTAHGCHISLGFGESTTSGAVTGLGVAGRFTLGLADLAYPGTGTLGVLEAEVYSFGDASDPAGNAIAMLRIGNNGNANGQADVDDDAVCFAFDGWTSADGNMVVKAGTPGAMGNATWSVRCKMPDGSLAYLNFTAAAVTA